MSRKLESDVLTPALVYPRRVRSTRKDLLTLNFMSVLTPFHRVLIKKTRGRFMRRKQYLFVGKMYFMRRSGRGFRSRKCRLHFFCNVCSLTPHDSLSSFRCYCKVLVSSVFRYIIVNRSVGIVGRKTSLECTTRLEVKSRDAWAG